jgi:hypothetical protein
MFGALTIVTLIALTRGVPAWRAWQHAARVHLRTTLADLARTEARVSAQPALVESLAVRNARFLALAPTLLSGESPASAGATLAGLVSGAAASANVRLGAVQVQAPAAGDSSRGTTFTPVRVAVDVTGDIRGLTQMLALLERGPVRLAIRALAITQPAPAVPASQMEALHATLTLEGLMLTTHTANIQTEMSQAQTPPSGSSDRATMPSEHSRSEPLGGITSAKSEARP